MAVIIYCKQSGGYGDLLFGLKLASGLQKQLRDVQGYKDHVYLVTDPKSVDDIRLLGGGTEFGVKVTSAENINDALVNGQITVDYLLSGPAFHPDTNYDMFGMNAGKKMPDDIKMLFLTEYDMARNGLHVKMASHVAGQFAMRKGGKNKEQLAENIQIEKTGFGGQGVLISNGLFEAAEARAYDPARFQELKEQAWETIESQAKLADLRGGQRIEDYHQNTRFVFEYSSQNQATRYQEANDNNSCLHFLKLQEAYTKSSTLNQDVLSIGHEREKKLEALQSMTERLIGNGYTHIEFVDTEAPDQSVVLHHDEAAEQAKVYRMLYAKTLPHTVMEALQIATDELVGLTGDQSLSEGISMRNKVIVYECLGHKEVLHAMYNRCVAELTANEKVQDVLGNLAHAQTDQGYDDLAELLQDPEVKTAIFQAHEVMAEQNNVAMYAASQVTEAVGLARFQGAEVEPLSAEELGPPQLDVVQEVQSAEDEADIEEAVQNGYVTVAEGGLFNQEGKIVADLGDGGADALHGKGAKLEIKGGSNVDVDPDEVNCITKIHEDGSIEIVPLHPDDRVEKVKHPQLFGWVSDGIERQDAKQQDVDRPQDSPTNEDMEQEGRKFSK